MILKTGPLIKVLTAILAAAIIFLLAGCGGESSRPTPLLRAGPTLSASREFQGMEKSHFGFFRPGGSFPYVSELKVHWARPHPGPFIWGSIEKSKGSYDWSETDQYVRDAGDYRVLITATIWPYADWDQEQCREKLPDAPFRFMPAVGDYHGKPCDDDGYRRFVTALVERYDGDGVDDMPGLSYPIKYWEVINEPEGETGAPFFKGSDQSADYLEILKTTFLAIRAADPDAKVLNGGIAWIRDQTKLFWEDVLGQGSQFVDVLNIHAVPAPDDFNLDSLSTLTAELDLKKPVWVTEVRLVSPGGSQSHGPENQGPDNQGQESVPGDQGSGERRTWASAGAPSEAEQDEWSTLMVKAYVEAFGRGADKLFHMGLDNATPAAPAARLVNCGVVIGGEPEEDHLQLSDCQRQKPFYAFKTMVAKIDYFDSVEKLGEGQYKFLIGGRAVYVLWGGQPLPAEMAGRVRETDIYGATKEVDAAGISLTGAPIYLEKL